MTLPVGYKPNIIDRWLHVSQLGYDGVERRIRGRYGMSPKVIVIHIQEGENLGSWQWFHVVKASSTVLISRGGQIWRLVPEEDGPWTNGDVQSPDAFVRAMLNKYGPDPNAYSLTIETEGVTGEFPKTEAQMHAVEWQVRDWLTRYPEIDEVYVIKHGQINSISRSRCPGDKFYNELMSRIKATPVPSNPVYAAPSPISKDGKPWDGTGDVVIGDRKFYGLDKPFKVTAIADGVQAHQYATRTSAFTRRALTKGEEFSVIGWCHGEEVNGDDRWWITKYFSRIDVNGTAIKPEDIDSDLKQPDYPEGTRIINGRVYFPAARGDKTTRKVRVTRRANKRAGASLKSKVVGTVNKGDIIEVEWWCFGGEVHDYKSWWIEKDPEGRDSIKYGARLWSAATEAFPEDDVI